MSDPYVELAPLRDAVLRLKQEEGASWKELARRCDYTVTRCDKRHRNPLYYVTGDCSRLKRRLGVMRGPDGRGVMRVQEHIQYRTAAHIVDKLGLDPVDCGV